MRFNSCLFIKILLPMKYQLFSTIAYPVFQDLDYQPLKCNYIIYRFTIKSIIIKYCSINKIDQIINFHTDLIL